MDLEQEVVKEVMDSFYDLHQEIENTISLLTDSSTEAVDSHLNALFRSIHSVKGNASMLQIDTIVNFTHALEEIAESLRSHRFPVSTLIGEVLNLGMDRVKDLHLRDIMGQPMENLQEQDIAPLFVSLANATPDTAEQAAREILVFFGADFVLDTPASDEVTESTEGAEIFSITIGDESRQADLSFFRGLAQQVDKQNQFWEERTENIFIWAQKLNRIAGNPVNSDQLSAAVYLHDIGMAFVPSGILDKKGKLESDEVAQIRMHPAWGHGLLSRMPGWDEAARMVLEHQEHFNGGGYPAGIQGEAIHAGARILAIIDAFFSITNGRADRSQRRSVVRAVSELNARSGTQFDPAWVAFFNDMIKQEIKAGTL